jgi:hypothetical protein
MVRKIERDGGGYRHRSEMKKDYAKMDRCKGEVRWRSIMRRWTSAREKC